MRRVLLVVAMIVMIAGMWSGQAQAVVSECVQGSLASYIADTDGCTVGDKLFTNFTFASGSGVVATDITVTPTIQGDLTGLSFQSGEWAVLGTGTVDTGIGFNVSVTDPNFRLSDAHLITVGSTLGENAGWSVDEVLTCLVAPAGCGGSGLPVSLQAFSLTLDGELIGEQLTDEAIFCTDFAACATSLGVSKDILSIALTGFSTLSIVTQLFSQVENTTIVTIPTPLPGALLLLGAGLAGLGSVAAWRRRAGK